jgi:hypothetical protein
MDDLESRMKALEDGHLANRSRIQENRQFIRASLAAIVFGAIVWGIPIAHVKWDGDDGFEFKRDTTSPELVIIGGLIAASLFMGDKPIDLLRSMLNKK